MNAFESRQTIDLFDIFNCLLPAAIFCIVARYVNRFIAMAVVVVLLPSLLSFSLENPFSGFRVSNASVYFTDSIPHAVLTLFWVPSFAGITAGLVYRRIGLKPLSTVED